MNLRFVLFCIFLGPIALAWGKPDYTYRLFSIPKFIVRLTLESSGNSGALHTDYLESILNEATTAHLVGSFESILDVSGNRNALSDIHLSVSAQSINTESFITAEVSGEALFYNYLLYKLDYTIDQVMIQGWVEDAFSHSTGGSQSYFNRIQVLLNGAQNVTVDLGMFEAERLDANNPGSHSAGEEFIANQNANTNTLMEEGSQEARNGVGLPLLFAVAMVGFFAGMFAYWKRDNRHVSGDDHLLLGEEECSDYSEEDNRLSGELEFDEGLYESYDEEDGIQFIPVPAKFDKHPMDKKTKAVAKDVMPRRYVKPASPFEILYGAAFSHRDQAKVAKAHGMKARPRTIKVSGQKIRRKEPLKPMNTISESNDEDDGIKVPPSESFFPQIMSSISHFMEKRTQPGDDLAQENKKEDFVVYRDFPRHDGTPCVMFSSADDVEWEATGGTEVSMNDLLHLCSACYSYAQLYRLQKNSILIGDHTEIDGAPGSLSPYKSPEQSEQIDDFVDKLENLMAARSRQYEERKQMDKEIAQRKKARMAERKKAKEEEESSDTSDSSEDLLIDVALLKNDTEAQMDSHIEVCQEAKTNHIVEEASNVQESLDYDGNEIDHGELVDMPKDDEDNDSPIVNEVLMNDVVDTMSEEINEYNSHEEEGENISIAELLSLPNFTSHPSSEECVEPSDPKRLVLTHSGFAQSTSPLSGIDSLEHKRHTNSVDTLAVGLEEYDQDQEKVISLENKMDNDGKSGPDRTPSSSDSEEKARSPEEHSDIISNET